MLRIFTSLFTTIVLSILFFTVTISSYAQQQKPPAADQRFEAVVTKVLQEEQRQAEGSDKMQLYQKLEIKITSGNKKDKKVVVENGNFATVYSVAYKIGDEVIITDSKDFQGQDKYFITDYVRRTPLYLLFLIFVGLTVAIGRKRGVSSLLGLGFSFLVIFIYILPNISGGSDPIFTAILASLVIVPVTFCLSHGINRKTAAAIIGTFIALIITGLLASYFVDAAHLTGFASEEAGFLETLKQGSINIKGILLAGIIIGALGILNDITVSQASVVSQLKLTDPTLPLRTIFKRAMDVGQDHIASMANTLILVYAGAALPLFLLFINSSLPYGQVINYEIIAEEIIRTLVVSIGLILAVPITTIVAASIVNINFSDFIPGDIQKREKLKQTKFIKKDPPTSI